MARLGVEVSAEPLGDAAVDAIAEGMFASGDGMIATVHAAPDSAINATAASPNSDGCLRNEPATIPSQRTPELNADGTSTERRS